MTFGLSSSIYKQISDLDLTTNLSMRCPKRFSSVFSAHKLSDRNCLRRSDSFMPNCRLKSSLATKYTHAKVLHSLAAEARHELSYTLKSFEKNTQPSSNRSIGTLSILISRVSTHYFLNRVTLVEFIESIQQRLENVTQYIKKNFLPNTESANVLNR